MGAAIVQSSALLDSDTMIVLPVEVGSFGIINVHLLITATPFLTTRHVLPYILVEEACQPIH